MALLAAASLGMSAQTTDYYYRQGDMSVVGGLGYQSNYGRFGISGQYRYYLSNVIRVAPDITFFFPKDKVTGLDINLNLHYVINMNEARFTFYPLAGIGMQNNFYGKQTVIAADGQPVETDSRSKTNLGVNLGAGITYNLTPRSYLNLEGKFMFGDQDNAVFMLGYGWRF